MSLKRKLTDGNMPPSKKAKKSLNYSKVFLTFPQCSIEPVRMLELMEERWDIKWYIIAQEKHKEEGLHIHAYLHLEKRKCTTPKNFGTIFDFEEGGKTWHGHYECVKSDGRCKKYCRKDGNFVTNIKISALAQAAQLAMDGDKKAAWELVKAEAPAQAVLNGRKIRDNLEMMAQEAPSSDEDDGYKFFELEGMGRWNRRKYSLWLMGPSKLGKTEYAKAQFSKPLLVRHKQGLAKLKTGKYDGIVFDDFNVSHWPREVAIHLADLANESEIDIKYGTAVIPKGMPRIFCSNTNIWPEDPTGAIKRRVYTVFVSHDLRDMDEDSGDDKPSDDWDRVTQGEPMLHVGGTMWTLGEPNN